MKRIFDLDSTDEDEIPNFSDPNSILPDHGFDINEHVINAFNNNIRLLLISPGMNQPAETNSEINEKFNRDGPSLKIPNFLNRQCQEFNKFCFLGEFEWTSYFIPTMSRYCTFFKESGNLGQCSSKGISAGLVMLHATQLTSEDAATNVVNVLQHGFPGLYPYRQIYRADSYETSIPTLYQTTGLFGAVNTQFSLAGLQSWSTINTINLVLENQLSRKI